LYLPCSFLPISLIIKTTAYNKKEFSKASIAAFLGTVVDYLTFFGLTKLFGLWYIYAQIVGAFFGAITNFLLGRYWAFQAKEDNIKHQAIRYALVSTGSLILNTTGLYLLAEYTPLNPDISKVVIGIIVAVTYNYLMQKYFVFRK